MDSTVDGCDTGVGVGVDVGAGFGVGVGVGVGTSGYYVCWQIDTSDCIAVLDAFVFHYRTWDCNYIFDYSHISDNPSASYSVWG